MNDALNTVHEMTRGFVAGLPRIIFAALIALVFYAIGRFIRAGIERGATTESTHRTLRLALGRIAHVAVAVVGTLVAVALAFPAFTPGNLISALGIGGIAIGFAFKDIFENFLAGILILITRPFRIGDHISYEKYEGTVEDIYTRATWLKTADGRRILIPNAELFKNAITVNTAFDYRRTEHDLRLPPATDVDRARSIILDILREAPGVVAVPAPDVILTSFDETRVVLKARWWTSSSGVDMGAIRDHILREVRASGVLDDHQVR
jgi:small-conductance mechanosensitive channel